MQILNKRRFERKNTRFKQEDTKNNTLPNRLGSMLDVLYRVICFNYSTFSGNANFLGILALEISFKTSNTQTKYIMGHLYMTLIFYLPEKCRFLLKKHSLETGFR